MKAKYLILFMVIAGCYTYDEPMFWAGQSEYVPVLIKRSDFEASVKSEPAREVHQAGKIYTIGNYIFLNELYEGIHVIDNTDPSKPVNMGFINIPGNVDIAVKGESLYADSAVDLLAINISNPQQIVVTSRTKDVFPEKLPPNMDYIPYQYTKEQREEKDAVIINWVKL